MEKEDKNKSEKIKESEVKDYLEIEPKPKNKIKGLNLDDVKVISKSSEKTKKEVKEEQEHKQKVQKTKIINNNEVVMNDIIRKRKVRNSVFITFLILFILAVLLSTSFALINMNNEKIITNTFVSKVKVSGLAKDEAIKELDTTYNNLADKPVTIKYENYSREISPNEIDFRILSEKSVNNAYNIGRSTNIFKNNYTILFSYFKDNNIDVEYNYDRFLLDKIMEDVNAKIPNQLTDNSYEIKGTNLIISRGKEGILIVAEDLKQQIVQAFVNLNSDTTITIPVTPKQPDPINIDKIYKEVTVKDIKINMTLDKAKQMLSENKAKYTIPVTLPKVVVAPARPATFKDVLSTVSSFYDDTNKNRSINIKVSSKDINGAIVYPGRSFSFNSFVGNTVAADGYKLSIGYAGGKAVPMIGGGVCQVSSTIYAAALEIDLRITERFNHVCPVLYLPPGLDSATALGSCDLRFINNRSTPIKLEITAANGVNTVKILGTKQKNEPVIKLTSTKINNVPFRTSYIYDGSLKPGEEKVEIKGLNGFTSKLYQEKYLNGVLVSKRLVSTDTYKPLHEVIRRNNVVV